MKVALHSEPARLGDVEANVQRVADAVAEAGKAGDDLVVFPELYLTGYNIGDDVQRLAFGSLDERLAPLWHAGEEHGVHTIVGAPHTPRPGMVHNAALCVDDDGQFHWVHKRVLPTFTTFQEALFFAAGTEQRPWQTRLGDLGVGICYDLYFPELQKAQMLAGADVLINISASPSSSRRFFEALLPARAIENAAFSLYANNIGAQDGIVFWGGSRGYGPRGELLGSLPAYEEGVLRLELDLRGLAAARESRPTLRDSAGGLLMDRPSGLGL